MAITNGVEGARVEKLAEGYGLVEGPVWDGERGLLFSDVLNGGVFALAPDGSVSCVVEHRRGIGGMALHAAGGLVVSGRNIAFKPFDGGPTQVLLDRDEANGNVGYNDITTDAAGRIYAGSLGSSPVFEDGREPAAGDLYLIDLDGSARRVGYDIKLTNGLGFSPDGAFLYHADSRVSTVWRYSVHENGDLGEKAPFIVTERGAPDGLAVSADGRLWVALAGGHGVGVFDAGGAQTGFVEIPAPMCTSVCFGGEDLCTLFIVSGSEGGAPNSGAVFATESDVPGLPVAPARVALN